MKVIISISLLFILYGCISESNLKPVIPMQIIHSNSSKVWVLDSETVGKDEKTPEIQDFKTAFIFYSDGEFIEQKMASKVFIT